MYVSLSVLPVGFTIFFCGKKKKFLQCTGKGIDKSHSHALKVDCWQIWWGFCAKILIKSWTRKRCLNGNVVNTFFSVTLHYQFWELNHTESVSQAKNSLARALPWAIASMGCLTICLMHTTGIKECWTFIKQVCLYGDIICPDASLTKCRHIC